MSANIIFDASATFGEATTPFYSRGIQIVTKNTNLFSSNPAIVPGNLGFSLDFDETIMNGVYAKFAATINDTKSPLIISVDSLCAQGSSQVFTINLNGTNSTISRNEPAGSNMQYVIVNVSYDQGSNTYTISFSITLIRFNNSTEIAFYTNINESNIYQIDNLDYCPPNYNDTTDGSPPQIPLGGCQMGITCIDNTKQNSFRFGMPQDFSQCSFTANFDAKGNLSITPGNGSQQSNYTANAQTNLPTSYTITLADIPRVIQK